MPNISYRQFLINLKIQTKKIPIALSSTALNQITRKTADPMHSPPTGLEPKLLTSAVKAIYSCDSYMFSKEFMNALHLVL